MKKIIEKAKQAAKGLVTKADMLSSASIAVGVGVLTTCAHAEALTTTMLTSASTSIIAEITAALVPIGLVLATTIGVRVGVKFFKSLAK